MPIKYRPIPFIKLKFDLKKTNALEHITLAISLTTNKTHFKSKHPHNF